MSEPQEKGRFTGRHALIAILAFFGVVFFANGMMVFEAIDSFSGLETDEAYKRGRDYNREIESAKTQAALGWRLGLSTVGGPGQVKIAVRLRDKADDPVFFREGKVLVRRPARQDLDEIITLQPTGEGRYEGVAKMPLEGCWRLRTEFERDGQVVFRQDDAVMIGENMPIRCE
ncbi:FixH family protein [Pseudokordiimonas caeni]|uniref:FixH family protein n=1 Tax=Pseudokordiimonas caeni TaxID=2997908 RepID=UPI00281184D6|nr:FixH family protein [Pseudokordiimonas caeni]